MKLEEVIETESYDTAFWMAGIYDPEFAFAHMGELASEVCRKLRTIAISVLVTHGKVGTFQHNLIRSGKVRERYLVRCLSENQLFDHHRSSGWHLPLMDTIAAGDMTLALRIAELSPTDFRAGHEYEDDYCYVQLIHSLLGLHVTDVQALLTEFERYNEGEPNIRLDLIRSLLNQSQKEFDSAFDSLLEENQQKIDADIERGRFEDLHVNAARRIFIEGLAILRLAEKVGLRTEEEYLFCPSIARVPMTEPFPGE